MRRFPSLAALAVVVSITGCASQPSQSAGGSVRPAGWGLVGPSPSEGVSLSPSPTAVMFDSVTLSAIPARPFALAGYTTGYWPTYPVMRHAWPTAHTVSIAVTSTVHADCLDVEPGDATPSDVPAWVRSDIRAGYHKPCVYSDWWEFTHEIRPVLEHAHISRSEVWEWDADYRGCPRLDPGFDVTQCTDHAYGRNLDESIVTRAFLSIATPPLLPFRPAPEPSPSVRLKLLDELLGAHSKHDPHGHDCEKPPYRHAYPSAAYDHACSIWANQARASL